MTAKEVAAAYARFGAFVWRRCRFILRNDAGADDATQETFIRLLRFGDGFLAADSQLAWLYTVAERVCFDLLARKKSRNEVTQQEETPSQVMSSAENATASKQLVLRYFSALDERMQRLALLHYVDELPQERIAEQLGWSRRTIYQKLGELEAMAWAMSASLKQEGHG